MPWGQTSWSKILLIGFIITLALPLVWETTDDSLEVYSLIGKAVGSGPVFQRTVSVFAEERFYANWTRPFRTVFLGSGAKRQASAKGIISMTTANMTARTPVYFLSHGGPTIMFDKHHQAFEKLQAIGQEITQKVQPKAIVVVSAHWQGEPQSIEVNTAETMPLIYDFYGFPPELYEVKFPNVGSPELAKHVLELLSKNEIKAEGVRRGLDHGAWAGFHVAFNPERNPANVPIVQVSLFDSDDPDQHYRLGAALQSLREEGVVIICSGMAVHNLRDMQRTFGRPGALPYALSFDAALKEAVEEDPEKRQQAMAELLKRSDARKAHPSFDHLLPVHVAAGAAGSDPGHQIWTKPEGSTSWAQYRFGEAGVAA